MFRKRYCSCCEKTLAMTEIIASETCVSEYHTMLRSTFVSLSVSTFVTEVIFIVTSDTGESRQCFPFVKLLSDYFIAYVL